jgi:L-malate glycosyltransferase
VKILFYNHTGYVSGAERVLLMILEGLDRADCEPVLLCPANGSLTEMSPAHVKKIVIDPLAARFTLRPNRLWSYLKSFCRVIREARASVFREEPDVIHANSIRAGLVMSVATFGRRPPIVWHVHDLLPRHPLSSAIRWFVLLSRRNRIVAVSFAVATRFRGKLLRSFQRRVPVTVIHNAVDVQRFYRDLETRLRVRRDLGIDESQLVVGTVGQLTPRKRQLELIRAFSNIAQEFPRAVLLIIGEAIFNHDEEYATTLINEVENLGLSDSIRFLGAREDVPSVIRALDCLVVNSRSEPFGLTVVEGMASEIAVLATAVDGIPEIIRHGKSGWLVEVDDHRQLVEGLRALLQNPALRSKLGREGRAHAIARFSSQRYLGEINSLYRSLEQNDRMPHRRLSKRFEAGVTTD